MPVTLENLEESVLPLVIKPNRYLGNYVGAYRKDHGGAAVKMALAFPDCFDLGMSHLGIKILYRIINEREDALAELVFSPWTDMEEQLRRHGLPLFTLESRTPVSEFDVIGFSLQYELHYTTVLNMLDLGGIPLLSEERGEGDPLVIAGGPCAFNPEPMAPFFDAFLVGDGEDMIHAILDEAARWKKGLHTRSALLRALAGIDGVYVPSLYEAAQNSLGHLVPRPREDAPAVVRPAAIAELTREKSEPAHLVPLTDVTHGRLSVEVMRGCPRACRFCMPGAIYSPVRGKSQDDVLAELRNGMAWGGWDEISLLSLSTSDYKGVADLVQDISRLFLGRGVNVSLPSMRPGTLPPSLARTLTYVRKSGLTFAPEAGTERLRRVINKRIGDDEVVDSVKVASAAGWNSVKLYFMIGLPTETDEDVEAIARLAGKLKAAARSGRRKMAIKTSVAGFAPKPHTPFQWEAQLGREDMARRMSRLKRLMRSHNMNVRWRDPETTFLEGLLSRGDRKTAEAVLAAWRKGCKFDGWSDLFMFDKWMEALEETGTDYRSYLAERDSSEPQPWSHIMVHGSKERLARERERAYGAAGRERAGEEQGVKSEADDEQGPEVERGAAEGAAIERNTTSDAPGSPPGGGPAGGAPFSGSQDELYGRARRKTRARPRRTGTCFRLRYSKGESVRFISHLDVVRAFDRALRKAGLPIAFSQGFSKHPKMSFGPPLAVGLTSSAEYLDLEFSVSQSLGFVDALNASLPEGISVSEGRHHREAKPDSLMKAITSAGYRVSFSSFLYSEIEKNGTGDTVKDALRRAGERLGDAAGETSDAGVDWRRVVMDVRVNGDGGSLLLKVRLNVRGAPKVGEIARELLAPFAFDSRLLGVERTDLWVERSGALISPFEALDAGL
jgi:radical SAM family uncharacterized protein/radical SAM-linked protein